jgi:hypothetical protein
MVYFPAVLPMILFSPHTVAQLFPVSITAEDGVDGVIIFTALADGYISYLGVVDDGFIYFPSTNA